MLTRAGWRRLGLGTLFGLLLDLPPLGTAGQATTLRPAAVPTAAGIAQTHVVLPALPLAFEANGDQTAEAGLLAGGSSATAAPPAQPPAAVLTLVAADGGLWALPESGPPVLLRPDIARGATVRHLAWHPERPELLLVRDIQRDEPACPRCRFDTLVRVDLATGAEAILYADLGPQAAFLRPQYGLGGTWAYAGFGCCLAYQLVFFEGGARREVDALAYLPPADREALITAVPGPLAADGRLLLGAVCCSTPEAPADLAGYFLVRRDGTGLERISRGDILLDGALGPNAAWIAGIRQSYQGAAGPQTALTLIELPSGRERALVAASTLALGSDVHVSLEGTIAVASAQDGGFPPRYADLWTVSIDGSRHNRTNGAFPGATAFSWAPAAVVARLGEAPPAGVGPRAPWAATSALEAGLARQSSARAERE